MSLPRAGSWHMECHHSWSSSRVIRWSKIMVYLSVEQTQYRMNTQFVGNADQPLYFPSAVINFLWKHLITDVQPELCCTQQDTKLARRPESGWEITQIDTCRYSGPSISTSTQPQNVYPGSAVRLEKPGMSSAYPKGSPGNWPSSLQLLEFP